MAASRTYDLFAERVGFKLGWGCLVFYPYFYCVGLWARAGEPDPHAPAWLLVLAVVVFAVGWTLARGANMQKFFFKRDPTARAFGLLVPRQIDDDRRCAARYGALWDEYRARVSVWLAMVSLIPPLVVLVMGLAVGIAGFQGIVAPIWLIVAFAGLALGKHRITGTR